MSDKTELKPFDIKSFSPKQDQYIEASAGTGKTYTIRKISAELVKNDIRLSEVLFVTYTEKAAGEMRDRIREEMSESLEKALPSEKRLFERACQDVDKAMIGTIHSFCRKTLHDFAYEANVPFDMDNADDQAAEAVIDRLIRDEWESDICSLPRAKSLPNDVNDIKDLLKNALKSYSPEKKFVIPPVNIQEWIEQNPEASQHWAVLNNNKKASYKAKQNKPKEFSVQELIDKINKWPGANTLFKDVGTELIDPPDTPLGKALSYFFSIRDGKKIKLASADEVSRSKFLNEKTKELYSLWQQEKARQKAQSFDDMISAVREAVCPDGNAPKTPTFLCKKIRDTYKIAIIDEFQDTNEFQWNIFETVFLDSDKNHLIVVGDPKQSIYSFQGADLQVYRKATKSIKNGSKLATNFRSSISMIKACNSMFSVGDESNYPFLPKGDFTKSEYPKDIGNQRQNALFNGTETRPVWVSPIVPEKGFARFAVQKIIECCKETNGKTALQVFDRGEAEPRNVNFSDFVILGRTRPEMNEIKECLTAVGIPFVLYKDSSLFDSRECAEWISVLRMLAAPNLSGYNSKLLNSVFVTDFFGIDLLNLSDDPQKNTDEKALSQIAYWRLLASRKQWTELQEQIYEDTRVEQKLSVPSRLQDLMKLRQIGNYIFGYLYEKKATLQQAIKHLEGLSKDNKKASDEEKNLVAKGTDFKAVRLMTIHASKGLEFPVVISCAGYKGLYDQATGPFVYGQEEQQKDKKILQKYVGFDRTTQIKRQNEEIVEWHRLLYVDYTRASSLLILPQYDRWFACEKDGRKDAHETRYGLEMRKLKLNEGKPIIDDKSSWTFLTYAHGKLCEENKFAQSREWDGSWDVDALRKEVSAELAFFNKDEKKDSSKLPSDEILKAIRKTIKKSSLYQHSYSSIDRKSPGTEIESIDGHLLERAGDEPDDDVLSEINEDSDYPRGNLYGEALHQVFEELDFVRIGGLSLEEAQKDTELFDLITNKFLSQGLPIGKHPNWMTRTVEIIWNTMNASLPEIQGDKKTGKVFSLKKLDSQDRLAEMEFHMDVNEKDCTDKPKTFCKGYMDLVFVIKGEGKEYYSVLDWKSNLLQKYDSKSTFEAAKEHYSIQMVLYSYSLIMWLCSIKGKSPEDVFKEHFGGIYYVFARGCKASEESGIFAHTWNTFDELKAAYKVVWELMFK